MEKVNEVIKENNKENNNFFSYVFNFDEDNKAGIYNMLQYTLLAIIPVVVLLKLVKHYVPEDDDSKPSLEILVEVILQLIIIFLSIWFIDKIIRFIPTLSGVCYFKFNETNFIVPILIVLITMQTKLGAKINLILDRFSELWGGSKSPQKSNKESNVKVRQPLAGSIPQHQPSQADSLHMNTMPSLHNNISPNTTTLISDLPSNQQQMNTQSDILDPSPLMAANEALGGIFGSAF
tara:strand:+ start:608 stop:1312 length:705 start_codon:yes stop_codon:yes gene_type:complete